MTDKKAIGPTFPDELKDVGLFGLPFAWGDDGSFSFSDDMTEEQIEDVMAVYEAHDPTKPEQP